MQVIRCTTVCFYRSLGRPQRVFVRAELDYIFKPRHMRRTTLVKGDVHDAGLRLNCGCHLSNLLSGGP